MIRMYDSRQDTLKHTYKVRYSDELKQILINTVKEYFEQAAVQDEE